MSYQYKIFALPNCEKCKDVKNYLLERSITFEEISLAQADGMKKFRSYFKQVKDRVERDDAGGILMPVVLVLKGGEIKDIAHNKEGLEKCLLEV